MKCLGWILCVGLVLSAGAAQAATWVVNPGGTGDFPTIQTAINSASVVDGDTVELTNGTFAGSGNRDIDYLGKAIVVRSQNGNPDSCIIDCEDAGRGFYFHSGEGAESVLEGISVTNGTAYRGGGVYCGGSSPTFANCTISGSSANEGGGIQCRDDSSPVFTSCTVIDNSATWGGGLSFESNSVPSTFSNCVISGNSASAGGGGVCFVDNTALILFTHCTITGNSRGSYEGAGVRIARSAAIFSNTIIAFSQGEGVYFWDDSSDSQVEYCDFYGNTGGALVGNGPPGIGELVTTNANGDSCDTYMNIFLDPLFVDTAAGDFHLDDYSPCIGAADPTDPPPFDKDGNPRPNPPGSNPDIGAYEHWRDVPLPVELTTFQAFGGDGQVTLRWHTASEQDNDHFVLYKLRSGQEDFNMLAEIRGQGTTTEPHDYEYVDQWVQNGVAYEYQISDVDIAGHETFYGEIVSAIPRREAVPLEFALHPNWPNPFNPTTTIRYDVKENGPVSLKIFDLLGREVATLADRDHTPSSYTITWDATGFPSGIYLCRMDAERFAQVRKLLLVK